MKKALLICLLGVLVLSAGFLYFKYEQQIFFTYTTKIMYPASATDLRHEDSGPSFFGDGIEEFSFVISAEEIDSFSNEKPFGRAWQQGPYVNVRTKVAEDTPTQLSGSQQIQNTENILYSVEDFSPEGHTGQNFFLLVFDPATGQVLFAEDNS